MKKLLVVLGVLVLMSSAAFAQGSYFVDYYSNNGVDGAADQVIRIINVGVNGTPLTTPVGDICANVYAFDNQQGMVTCCSCRITPNEFAQAYVLADLVNIGITVTPVQPAFGVIKVVTTPAGATCNPTAPLTGADASAGVWNAQAKDRWGNVRDGSRKAVFPTEHSRSGLLALVLLLCAVPRQRLWRLQMRHDADPYRLSLRYFTCRAA